MSLSIVSKKFEYKLKKLLTERGIYLLSFRDDLYDSLSINNAKNSDFLDEKVNENISDVFSDRIFRWKCSQCQ